MDMDMAIQGAIQEVTSLATAKLVPPLEVAMTLQKGVAVAEAEVVGVMELGVVDAGAARAGAARVHGRNGICQTAKDFFDMMKTDIFLASTAYTTPIVVSIEA